MTAIFQVFINTLKNPEGPNFWTALPIAITVITSLGVGLFSVIKLINNSRVTKIEKILTFALVEDYQNWVRVFSKTQKFDVENLHEWLSSGKIAFLGYDYSVFKNFMNRLRQNGIYISTPDESWFIARSEEYKSLLKLSRAEW